MTAEINTVLDNEKVNVVSVKTDPDWVGEHTHPSNQFAVVLSPVTMTYSENGKEFSKDYNVGDVVWIDEVTHDHKPNRERIYLMVTLK